MTSPEASIRYTPELFPGDGAVTNKGTEDFLAAFMNDFRDYLVRVLTVLPR